MQLAPTLTDSLSTEIQTLVRQFSAKAVHAGEDLLDAGILDSANVVRLLLAIETRFGVTIPMEDVEIDSFRTVDRIADLVRQCKPAKAARPLNMAAAAASYHPARNAGYAVGDGPAQTEQNGVLREIHELFRDSLLVEIRSPDEDLFLSGILDSMGLVNLIASLETRFGFNVSLEDLDVAAFRTTNDIAHFVRQQAGHKSDFPDQTAK